MHYEIYTIDIFDPERLNLEYIQEAEINTSIFITTRSIYQKKLYVCIFKNNLGNK